jgi:hypothetical protein
MPEPKENETEKEFVKRCIPIVLDDNTAEDGTQAAAICHSLWRKAQEEPEKAGRVLAGRNVERLRRAWQELREVFSDAGIDLDAKAPDKEEEQEGPDKSVSLENRIRTVRQAWEAAFLPKRIPALQPEYVDFWVREVLDDAVIVSKGDLLYRYPYEYSETGDCTFGEPQQVAIEYKPVKQPEPGKGFAADETLVAFGGQVKALAEPEDGAVRVGGQLILFGSPEQKDFDGEWFAADTYYGPDDGNGADVLVHHGQPLRAELKDLAGRVLGPLKVVRNELGLFAETVLHLADEYEKMLYELIEAGKLAWSSGSVARLIRRDAATGKIVRWPIVEASLTPTPCEPRLAPVGALKSLPTTEYGRGRSGDLRRRQRLVEIELELLRLTELEE